MKKVLLTAGLIIAALLLGSTVTLAQHHGHRHGPKGSPFKAIEELEEELKLTPEQKASIEALQQKIKDAHKEQRKEEQKAREERHAQRKAMHESLKSEIDAILTPEQAQLLQEHHEIKMADAKAARKSMRKAMDEYHTQNVAPVLLAQRQKLEDKISEEDKATLAKIRAEHKPTREGKKKDAEQRTPRPHKETIKALVQKYNEDIKTLMDEIEPQREQWRKDMKAIAEANMPADHEKGHMRKEHHKGKHGIKSARFLLMDPDKLPENKGNSRN